MQNENKCYVFKQSNEGELPEFYFSVAPNAAVALKKLKEKLPQPDNLAGPKEWPKSVCDYFGIDLTKADLAGNIRQVWNWDALT